MRRRPSAAKPSSSQPKRPNAATTCGSDAASTATAADAGAQTTVGEEGERGGKSLGISSIPWTERGGEEGEADCHRCAGGWQGPGGGGRAGQDKGRKRCARVPLAAQELAHALPLRGGRAGIRAHAHKARNAEMCTQWQMQDITSLPHRTRLRSGPRGIEGIKWEKGEAKVGGWCRVEWRGLSGYRR